MVAVAPSVGSLPEPVAQLDKKATPIIAKILNKLFIKPPCCFAHFMSFCEKSFYYHGPERTTCPPKD
jgi:hypothetical protein